MRFLGPILNILFLQFCLIPCVAASEGGTQNGPVDVFKIPAAPFRLVESGSYASCWVYKVVDDQGRPVSLPKAFEDALDCPNVISVRGAVLTVNVGLDIRQLDLKGKQERTLFTVYKDNEGVSGPVFSPDGRRMAFVVIDQMKRHGQKESGRIIMVDTQASPPSLRKFDRAVHFQCGSSCFSVAKRDFGFKDSNTLFYRKHEMGDDPGQEVEIAL